MKATCPECGRVFDLTDETEAEEWAYGHDCEPRDESLYGCPDHPGVVTLNKRMCPSVHYTPEQAKAHAKALLADLKRNYPNHKPGDPVPERYL